MRSREVLLGAYAAGRCARVVHNDFDRTIDQVPYEMPASLRARLDEGIAFEGRVRSEATRRLGDRLVDLSHLDSPAEAERHTAMTLRAMQAGSEVIFGGRLPDDLRGGRTGKPDMLIRVGDTADGRPGYVPADIKAHKVADSGGARSVLRWSTLERPEPGTARETERIRPRYTQRQRDLLQLAHYWRMLQECGHAAEVAPVGAIIGTDLVETERFPLVWFELDRPAYVTYSRSQGRATRSALERYDHEHGFRLRVARAAQQRTGSDDDPAPLVEPYYVDECEDCRWRELCLPLMAGHASAALEGGLDVREWRALQRLGVDSVDSLAGMQIDTAGEPTTETARRIIQDYLPEVSHHSDAPSRLAKAVQRARMFRDGRPLERTTTDPVRVPRADLEIDFDIEWDRDDHIYLWGFLVSGRSLPEPHYHVFARWSPLDDTATEALAAEALAWLHHQWEQARAADQTMLVYHYSWPERRRVRDTVLLGRDPALPSVAALDRLMAESFVDLHEPMRENFFGLHGLGLKKVAEHGAGFRWRDEDPGGLQSQVWLDTARHSGNAQERDEAIRRITDYNEDDVRATLAVRTWLASLG